MPIKIRCDKCQATYTVPDDRAGKTGKCRCGNPIAVPLLAPPPVHDAIFEDDEPAANASPIMSDEEVAGGVVCPRCGMLSRPGATCEWCSATLVTAPPPAPVPPPPGPAPGKAPPPSAAPAPSGEVRALPIIAEVFSFVFRYPGLALGSVATTVAAGTGLYFMLLIPVSRMVGAGANPFAMGPRGGPATTLAISLAALAIELCLVPFLMGPLYVMDELMVRGKSHLGALLRGYSWFWPIVGASACLMLLFGILGGSQSIAVQIGAHLSRRIALGAGLAVSAVAVWLGLCLMFTQAELVDRRSGAWEAIAGSWSTTEGYRGSLFVLVFLMGLGALVLFLGTSIPIAILAGNHNPAAPAIVMLLEAPLAVVVAAIFMAAQLIAYRELRGLEGASIA